MVGVWCLGETDAILPKGHSYVAGSSKHVHLQCYVHFLALVTHSLPKHCGMRF